MIEEKADVIFLLVAMHGSTAVEPLNQRVSGKGIVMSQGVAKGRMRPLSELQLQQIAGGANAPVNINLQTKIAIGDVALQAAINLTA